jgi:hypothetical protein
MLVGNSGGGRCFARDRGGNPGSGKPVGPLGLNFQPILSFEAPLEQPLTDSSFNFNHIRKRQGKAIKRRDAARSAERPVLGQAAQGRDWWCESVPVLRLSCPADAYSACAACGLPCWQADKAGNGWTLEKVLQKQDQNALRISPSSSLPGRNFVAPPVQRASNRRHSCLKMFASNV